MLPSSSWFDFQVFLYIPDFLFRLAVNITMSSSPNTDTAPISGAYNEWADPETFFQDFEASRGQTLTFHTNAGIVAVP